MKQKRSAVARRWWRGFLAVDGAAAVEFAMAAPVLVLLGLGVADYGVLMGSAASLESAACAGKTNPFIAGNPTDVRVFEYVTVSATQSFSPMVSYSSFGFPSSLTGQA